MHVFPPAGVINIVQVPASEMVNSARAPRGSTASHRGLSPKLRSRWYSIAGRGAYRVSISGIPGGKAVVKLAATTPTASEGTLIAGR